jgi:3-polyprenyl-4-hydroxybenzoate decarboxylase
MSDSVYRRARSLCALDRGDSTIVIGRDGRAREFRGDSALLVREILRALVAPLSLDGLLAHLGTVIEGASEARPAIEQALGLLVAAGAVGEGDTKDPTPGPAAPRGRLVLGISGAVAAAHTPLLVNLLLQRGFEVRVAMTRTARRFVSATSLQALTHHEVAISPWRGTVGEPVPYLDLARWAEVVLVAPASATTLFRIASGDFSDLVAATALSTEAPVVVAPSMNPVMYAAPPVARNVARLVEDGRFVLHPSFGFEVAEAPERRAPVFGSWPAPDAIVAAVEHAWRGRSPRRSADYP